MGGISGPLMSKFIISISVDDDDDDDEKSLVPIALVVLLLLVLVVADTLLTEEGPNAIGWNANALGTLFSMVTMYGIIYTFMVSVMDSDY